MFNNKSNKSNKTNKTNNSDQLTKSTKEMININPTEESNATATQPAMITEEELEKIETDLATILKTERKGWLEFYEECFDIKIKEKWRGKYKSYTDFLNNLGERCQVHMSSIYAKLNAGKTLNDYNKSVPENERIDPNNSHLTVENIALINSIVKNTDGSEEKLKIKYDLLKKAASGEMGKEDLQEAKRLVKSLKNKSNDNNNNNNNNNNYNDKITYNNKDNADNKTDMTVSKITAIDIIGALSNRSWLWAEKPYQRFKAKDNQPCFKLLGEFECRSGTSKKSRRVDAMVIENHTAEVSHEKNHDDLALYLHGIEIKVSKGDLLGDHKMAEYVPYCNYFYIAVPAELVEVAESIAFKTWGIISVEKIGDRAVAKIVKEPVLDANPGAIKKAYQSVISRTCISSK